MSKKSPSDLHKECRDKAFRARQRYFDKVDKLTKGQCICTDEWLHSHDKEVRNQTLADVLKIIDDKKPLVNMAVTSLRGQSLLDFILDLFDSCKEEIKNLKDNSQGTSNRYRDNDETCKVAKSSVNPDTRKGCGEKITTGFNKKLNCPIREVCGFTILCEKCQNLKGCGKCKSNNLEVNGIFYTCLDCGNIDDSTFSQIAEKCQGKVKE